MGHPGLGKQLASAVWGLRSSPALHVLARYTPSLCTGPLHRSCRVRTRQRDVLPPSGSSLQFTPLALPWPWLLLLLNAQGQEQINGRRCCTHFSPAQCKGPALQSLLSYFFRAPIRAEWAMLSGSPQEGSAWGHPSHPVSPALPNTGWGAAQTVWLNEEKIFPGASWAGAPSPQGGRVASPAASGSGASSPPSQAQKETDTKGTVGVCHPPEVPRVGMDATTNLKVWASPQGPGKSDQTPFFLPEAGQEGGGG